MSLDLSQPRCRDLAIYRPTRREPRYYRQHAPAWNKTKVLTCESEAVFFLVLPQPTATSPNTTKTLQDRVRFCTCTRTSAKNLRRSWLDPMHRISENSSCQCTVFHDTMVQTCAAAGRGEPASTSIPGIALRINGYSVSKPIKKATSTWPVAYVIGPGSCQVQFNPIVSYTLKGKTVETRTVLCERCYSPPSFQPR